MHGGPPGAHERTVDAGDTLYAGTYDAMGVAWPDELDAYAALAHAAGGEAPTVLELACGTGRVAIPLADAGCAVVALDRSEAMLALARAKRDDGNPQWVHGDMRTARLEVRADLALLAAHSFQFALTPRDQLATLATLRHHLRPRGRVALHVELPGLRWLAAMPADPPPVAQRPTAGALLDATTGEAWHPRFAWTHDRLAETVTFHCEWVRLDDAGEVLEARHQVPMSLKVLGALEVEHALVRAGFEVLERREWSGGTQSSPEARQLVFVAGRDRR